MSLESTRNKAEKLGIDLTKFDSDITEEKLLELIDQKQQQIAQDKKEKEIKEESERKAALDAKKNKLILQDVDGDEVDQSDYFHPRLEEEKLPNGKVLKPTDQTAPEYFNKTCGYPVDREDLIEAFVQFFPRRKGFLFYRKRDQEVYIIIVPLKYATTIKRSNESRPGDYQKHVMSFLSEGSVNIDSLKLKLKRIADHPSISTEALD